MCTYIINYISNNPAACYPMVSAHIGSYADDWRYSQSLGMRAATWSISHVSSLLCIKHWKFTFLYWGLDSPSVPTLLHWWDFEIALRHTTLGKTSPDERSARFRDLYRTTQHSQETDPRKPSKRTVAYPRAATAIGSFLHFAILKLGGVNWTST